MKKIAFGYSTRCNIRCGHCVATEDVPNNKKMELATAKNVIAELAGAGVLGISFTAGEPFIYFEDLVELLEVCRDNSIYSRVVTNSFWAKSPEESEEKIRRLQQAGLCQLRMSYSRWHQHNVPRQNVLNAAYACKKLGLEYFISFVTDFSTKDDSYEQYLRDNKVRFFPEPLIYSGRADLFERKELFTDYQDNSCAMNPYLAPDLNMYACCDAGSHFTTTNFFLLGNLGESSVDELFVKSENHLLYHCIRTMGITPIASFAGYRSRDIVTRRKCELCKELFDNPERLHLLSKDNCRELRRWVR